MAAWLASSRVGPATRVSALMAWLMRRSSSQGLPSGPRLITLSCALSRFSRKTSLKAARPDLAGVGRPDRAR